MVVNAVYAALLIGNILLIVASLFLGPRLLRACRATVFVNAIALILMVVPLLNLLLASHPPAGYRSAIRILLTFAFPILFELLSLLGLLRWRMRPH
jgi:NADH:ubiquinone oxidoreductase subunit 6 (subunit J)